MSIGGSIQMFQDNICLMIYIDNAFLKGVYLRTLFIVMAKEDK